MVTKENAPAIAQVCSRLDGIPLAIELAAARVKMMGIDQISLRLDDRFRLLTGGARTSLPRQQTLRAAIDWSFNLLSEHEKILLRRLAVFVGGWILEAAESICGKDHDDFDVLDLLSHLVDKSLVIVDETKIGTRYRMLETTRQYGREKLLDSGESEAMHNWHRDWFLDLVDARDPREPVDLDWYNFIESELDNLRAALAWSEAKYEFEIIAKIAFALSAFWESRGYIPEGRKWLECGLSQRESLSKTMLAKTLYITRRFALKRGDDQIAEAYGKESVALFRELGDKRDLAWALRGLGGVYTERNERERSQPIWAEAMSLFQEVSDKVGMLYLLMDFAIDAFMNNEYARGLTTIDEYQSLAHELDDKASIAGGVIILGVGELFHGNLVESEKLLRKGLALSRPFGETDSYISCLVCLAAIADKHQQSLRAARLWGAAQHLYEVTGLIPSKDEITNIHEPMITSLRAQLGESPFEAACAEGFAMTTDEAIDYALDETNE